MDLLSDFLEGDVSLLPVGHLELVQEGKDLLDLLVVFLDIITSNAEVSLHLVQHFIPYLVELH